MVIFLYSTTLHSLNVKLQLINNCAPKVVAMTVRQTHVAHHVCRHVVYRHSTLIANTDGQVMRNNIRPRFHYWGFKMGCYWNCYPQNIVNQVSICRCSARRHSFAALKKTQWVASGFDPAYVILIGKFGLSLLDFIDWANLTISRTQITRDIFLSGHFISCYFYYYVNKNIYLVSQNAGTRNLKASVNRNIFPFFRQVEVGLAIRSCGPLPATCDGVDMIFALNATCPRLKVIWSLCDPVGMALVSKLVCWC